MPISDGQSSMLENNYKKFVEKKMDLDHKRSKMQEDGMIKAKRWTYYKKIRKNSSTGMFIRNRKLRFPSNEVDHGQLRYRKSCSFD